MNEDKYNLYDNLVATSIINMNNFSKNTGKIILKDFDILNPKHLFLFNASILSTMYKDIDRVIYLDTNLIDYLKIKWHNRKKAKIKKYCEYMHKTELDEPVDIDYILNYMADAYDVSNGIFIDIYFEYYAGENL